MKRRRQSSETLGSHPLRKKPRISAAVDDNRTNPTGTRMREVFKYEPLNHNNPSIRLLRFEDDGETSDQIQCVMRHASTEADYICLSYRWGTDKPTHRVTINGKAMYIRKNLYDFLTVQKNKASQSHEKKLVSNPWLWIDALCIDQDNVSERNHQVQQMGNIFARAEQVFIWLGLIDEKDLKITKNQEKEGLLQVKEYDYYLRYSLLNWIRANQYWRRAWILQEVVLAKQAMVILRDEEMRLEDLEKDLWSYKLGHLRLWSRTVISSKMGHSRDLSLIRLIAEVGDRECSKPRDRIFSLLSLCDKGQHLKVDYNISEVELMVEIFNHCKDELCFCSAAVVALTLELQSIELIPVNRTPALQPYFEIDVHLLATGPSIWCHLDFTKYHLRSTKFSASPGMIFNIWQPCDTFRQFSVYWRIPFSCSEKELVWLEPYAGCPKNLVMVLCEYGTDFKVFKKNGRTEALVAARQHSSEPTATEVHAVSKEFRNCQGLEQDRYGERHRFSKEDLKALEIYTVRLSFAVLAKINADAEGTYYGCRTFCSRKKWAGGNFDPPRIVRQD
ncbi:uncharacterized protein N0V89_011149 [Didymosphaeria variabile]|uniref:Heterokaryon incompatibility domain-containing protein n=1 Tax=Didymosphaeria variabile TaxID=1932322 RepID=A0A9W9C653_9PLEO|nr:uncharacterized protein N0V89_011149 [Didymosphaeria variabile]KAJ4347210.1 hypothetical protein N0V89_011149 [Didymosphaeria variabile]